MNSKSPGFVSKDSAPTISTTYSSFSRACFPKVIYHTLPETGQHETGENSEWRHKEMQAWSLDKNCGKQNRKEKWKHAQQLLLPYLGRQETGECREGN